MLNDDEIVTSVQEESDPVDDEMDEEDNNNSESSKGPLNADAFSALETAMVWYEQQSAAFSTTAALENQRPCSEKTDEAHFWLNGYVNKQNCRIRSEANPQVYVETPLHSEKLTVWCALWAGGIIGPYFFKNDKGHNVTVNGERYRAMITKFFIPELNNHDVQELWFQQDGATCHIARTTIDLLKDTFGDRIISRFGPVNWPPRSCDLTPLDYFLWGYVKSLVYADKPQTLYHLEDNIRRVIADIRPQMLEKSSKIGRPDWTTSEPAVAVLCQKSYLRCNATKLSF
ncbi:transposable element Tc3 transposase [Trichonephila clavipes]|nr:transposable element Tc3 transposase [Trichonephila clavipes]